jgi:hypothetical protein
LGIRWGVRWIPTNELGMRLKRNLPEVRLGI